MATRNSGWHTLSSKSRASATHSPFTESHVNVLTLFSYRLDIAQWRQQTDPQHRARETRKLQPHRTREPRPSQEKKNSGHATTQHRQATRAGRRLEVGQQSSARSCVQHSRDQRENNGRCAIWHRPNKRGHNHHARRRGTPSAKSKSRHS